MGMKPENYAMLDAGRAFLAEHYPQVSFLNTTTALINGKRVMMKTSQHHDLVFSVKSDGMGWAALSDADYVFAVMLEKKAQPQSGLRFYMLDARKVEAQMDAVRAERQLKRETYIAFITPTGDGDPSRKHRFGLCHHGKLLGHGKL